MRLKKSHSKCKRLHIFDLFPTFSITPQPTTAYFLSHLTHTSCLSWILHLLSRSCLLHRVVCLCRSPSGLVRVYNIQKHRVSSLCTTQSCLSFSVELSVFLCVVHKDETRCFCMLYTRTRQDGERQRQTTLCSTQERDKMWRTTLCSLSPFALSISLDLSSSLALTPKTTSTYNGVATIRSLLKMIGLFCKRAL